MEQIKKEEEGKETINTEIDKGKDEEKKEQKNIHLNSPIKEENLQKGNNDENINKSKNDIFKKEEFKEEEEKKIQEEEKEQKIKSEEKIKEAIQDKSNKIINFANELQKILDNIKTTWEMNKENYVSVYENEIKQKINDYLNQPCIISYREIIVLIFKFLCQYFQLRMNYLKEAPKEEIYQFVCILLYNYNIFSQTPKINSIQNDIQAVDLIDDRVFYYIFKELLPDKEIENTYGGINNNCMMKYLLEYLFQCGFTDSFIENILTRDDLEAYLYVQASFYPMLVLNFCEKNFILKKNYNIRIMRYFSARMDFYLESPELKKVDINRYSFVSYLTHTYFDRIFGVFNRVLIELKESYEEDCEKFVISILRIHEFFLKQQKLEHRIYGLTFLTYITEFYRNFSVENWRKKYNDLEIIHDYTKNIIIKFLSQINIFDLLFGENIHEALVQRAYCLLSFLYKNKAFTPEQIANLWRLTQSKYQTISDSIITLFGQLLPEFSNDDCNSILKIVSNLNNKEVNEITLKLLENFFVGNERRENLINILYKLSDEQSYNNGLSKVIINKSRNILVKLLFNKNYFKDLVGCVHSCIYSLRHGYIINTNLFVFYEIMKELKNVDNNPNAKETFSAFNNSIQNYGMLVSYLDDFYFLFPVLLNTILLIKRLFLFLCDESIKIIKKIEEGNFEYDILLDIDNLLTKYKIYIKENKSFLETNNIQNISTNEMDIDKNEINTSSNPQANDLSTDSLSSGTQKKIDNYIKSILKDFSHFFKNEFLKNAVLPSKNEILFGIFNKLTITFENTNYINLLSSIIDIIFYIHLYANINFKREYFDFLHKILVENIIDIKEKEFFYNILGNSIKNCFINKDCKILTEENMKYLCLEKICTYDICFLPYSAFDSIKLFAILFNQNKGNTNYSQYTERFTFVKRFDLFAGFETLWEFYIKTEDNKIYEEAKKLLINIIELSSEDMNNRKDILNKIFNYLKKAKETMDSKESRIGFIRILKLISVVNGTKVTKNLFDREDKKNFICLNIKNSYYLNNQEKIIPLDVFKGLSIKELKDCIINNIICTQENLNLVNIIDQSKKENPITSLQDLRNEIYQNNIIILYKNKVLKEEFTIADYRIEPGDTLLILKGSGIIQEKYNISEEQLKEGYNQIKFVFGDSFSEEFMKKAIIKHRGDFENTVLFLTDKNNVINLKNEIEQNENNTPQKIEEIACLEEDKINLLLDALNNNDIEIHQNIWQLFSEIKYPESIISKSIGVDFSEIIEDKNINKMLLNLKLVNSLIFDEEFCHYNKVSKDKKNQWISKFITNEKLITQIIKTLSSLENNKNLSQEYILQFFYIFINWYYEIIYYLCHLVKEERFTKILSEIDFARKKNCINIINNTNTDSTFPKDSKTEEKKDEVNQEKFEILNMEEAQGFINILNNMDMLQSFFNIINIIFNFNSSKKKLILQNTYDILLMYFLVSPKKIISFTEEEKNKFLIFKILAVSSEKEISQITMDFIKILINISKLSTNNENIIDLQSFFLSTYYPCLVSNDNYKEKFYELYGYLLSFKNTDLNLVPIEKIISKLFNDIYQLSVNLSFNDNNSTYKIMYSTHLLCCCHQFYDEILKKYVNKLLEDGKDIIDLIYKCLFDIERENNNIGSFKYNNEQMRKYSFSLLNILLALDKKYLINILPKILSHHTKLEPKKENVYTDLRIRDINKEKLIGLKNFGATCYLNSLLQQMFMIPTFFRDLFSFNIIGNEDFLRNSVMFNMQITFVNLKACCMAAYPPYYFIKSFQNAFNGEPIKFNVQQDSDEFLAILCDSLEKEAKKFNRENFLENSFKGKIANEIVSLENEYPYYSQSDEPFYRVTLDIKGHQTLEEALDAYVKGEILDGDNKYYVEKYKKKISIRKSISLKKLGNQVIIHLKRFEFDFVTFTNNKLNDYLKFPLEINFKKWTRAYLRTNESNINGNLFNITEEEEENLIDEKMNYILTGILIHSGSSLQSGHYYSYIMDQETGNWHEFNDSRISDYNINEDLEKECFGNKVGQANQYGRGAYLLFYTKKECFRNKNIFQEIKINDNIYNEIYKENINFLNMKNYSSDVYQEFLKKFVENSINVLEDFPGGEKSTNKYLRDEKDTYDKILSVLQGNKENNIDFDKEEIEEIPENIEQIYNKCRSEIEFNKYQFKANKINIDNESESFDEEEAHNIINIDGGNFYSKKDIIKLCFYYTFGIVFQYLDYNNEKLVSLLQFYNNILKTNPGYSLWMLKSIEKHINIFTEIIIKYGAMTADIGPICKEIMEMFKTMFETIYDYECSNGNVNEKIKYFTKNSSGKYVITQEYLSIVFRLVKKLFCENLERCRKDFSRDKMLLEMFYSCIKNYSKISFVCVDYLLPLVSFITNNTLAEFRSETNPNFIMGGNTGMMPNNSYIQIFCEILLRCVTPGMYTFNKFSPYFIGRDYENDEDEEHPNFSFYPILPKGWEKIINIDFFPAYILYHSFSSSKEVICHLCYCDENISIKILKMINHLFRQENIPIPYLEKVFENTSYVFELKDSLELIRLDTLFQLSNNYSIGSDDDQYNIINTGKRDNNFEILPLFDYFRYNKGSSVFHILDITYVIGNIMEKYNNVFKYFFQNRNKIKWINNFFIELKNNIKFNEDIKNKAISIINQHPDLMSVIQNGFIHKLELN